MNTELQYNKLINDNKELINTVEVVSFDIFDTLLVRPYMQPTDLFIHLEEIENCKNFAKSRIEAENKAWKKNLADGKEDISLDEIYENLSDKYKILKDKEIDLEEKVLALNPEMFELYKYAIQKQKKVIITSDMYLSSYSLEKILKSKGISEYYKLYVSNTYYKRKHTGSLYRFIQNELKIPFDRILHIGDNYQSDYELPKTLGIKSVCYNNIINDFLQKNSFAQKFYKKNNDLQSSFFLATMILGWYFYNSKKQNINYWNKIGYFYGGPACYGYVKFIEKIAKEQSINDIMFVARDGYSLKKIQEIINDKINSYYVYAPRFTNLLCRLDLGKIPDVISERQNMLIDYLNEKGIDVSNVKNDSKSKQNFLNDNIKILKEFSENSMNEYRKYIGSLGVKGNKIAIVDGISASFSAQKLISDALTDKEVLGFYWAALTDHEELFDGNKFKRYHKTGKELEFAHFIELLMSSTEKPIYNVDSNNIEYRNNIDDLEKYKIDAYPSISEGEIEYALFYKNICKNVRLCYSSNNVSKWIENFIDNPTEEDIKMMENIKNGVDANHTVYKYVFPNWYETTVQKIKFIGFTFIRIKKSINKKKISFLGIPILKIVKNSDSSKYQKKLYLFNCIPICSYKGI